MMKRKSIITLFSGLLVFVMLLSGCNTNGKNAAEKKEKVEQDLSQEKLTLKVGTHGSFYPYAFVDEKSTEPQGFEVDLIREIAKRSNLEIDVEVAEWTGVFGMLDAGQLNSIACVVTPTDERKEKYDFSIPYLKMDIGIGVPKGKAQTITKIEDLAGKKIGVNAGGQAMKTLENLKKQVDFEIVAYETPTSMEYDCALGRIDGIYESIVAILQASERGDCDIEPATLDPIQTSVCAYPFVKNNKQNEEVIKRVDKAIKDMREDGTLMDLSKKWFGIDQITIEK